MEEETYIGNYTNHGTPKNEEIINEGVVATIDNYCEKGDELLIIHSHIDHKGKMVLNRVEAALLLVEIHKFLSI